MPRDPKPTPIESLASAVDAAGDGLRLDAYLARRFGQELDLSRRQAKTRIEEGSVFVEGRCVTRVEHTLREGERIELRLPASRRVDGWTITPEAVVFEDDDLIAIDKPAGLPTQPTVDARRHNLLRAVEDHLRARGGEPYAGLHHRLDRETSGVIVFAKSRRANKGLAEQIAGHRIMKTYVAITAPPREPLADASWRVRNFLRKSDDGRRAKMTATRSGGALAETGFTVLTRRARGWLIEARPLTGRMHQIRVHLADSGLPILGDALYAAPALARRAPRCMLHAKTLALRHPVTGAELRLEARLPDDFTGSLRALDENP